MNDSTKPLAPFLQTMGFFFQSLVEGKLGDLKAEQVSIPTTLKPYKADSQSGLLVFRSRSIDISSGRL